MSLRPEKRSQKHRSHRKSSRQFIKRARIKEDLISHMRKASYQSSLIKGADISGPINDEFWVDVNSPKRGAWVWHKVSDVKKEMKQYIPKARYDGYFDGTKDNPNRKVYFKVPVGAKLTGVHYNEFEMEEL